MKSQRSHTWRSADGAVHARVGYATKAEARAVAKHIRALTGRTYASYRCCKCGLLHIRLLTREAAFRSGQLARSA